jgi:RecQ family ATP-dependent DNA helicase
MKNTRKTLSSLIKQYGNELSENIRQLKGLLNDLCGNSKGEIFIILAAASENIPADLLASTISYEIILPRLQSRLMNNLLVSSDVALWAVETWALALGVVRIATTSENLQVEQRRQVDWSTNPEQKFEHWIEQRPRQEIPIETVPIYYNAGFTTQFVWNYYEEISRISGIPVQSLARNLSSFACMQLSAGKASFDIGQIEEKILAVYSGLLSRGFPTFSSIFIENTLCKYASNSIPVFLNDDDQTINYLLAESNQLDKNNILKALGRAFVAIDPRLNLTDISGYFHDEAESFFIEQLLPSILDIPSMQLAEFLPSKSDGSISGVLLGVEEMKKAWLFEDIGNTSNTTFPQLEGWEVHHVVQSEIRSGKTGELINNLSQTIPENSIIKAARENFYQPLWNSHIGETSLNLVLIPFGVSRIQQILLHSIQAGNLSLHQKEWKILFVERDVQCGTIAIIDFLQHIEAFNEFFGISIQLPSVHLLVNRTMEFDADFDGLLNDELIKYQITIDSIPSGSEDYSGIGADLLIDSSLLQCVGWKNKNEDPILQHLKPEGSAFKIRSVRSVKGERQLYPTGPILYSTGNSFETGLTFFLQNIFRKRTFRPGQLEILSRSLACKPVIGLLPTGAGKSLCYQLSALLQPGICLVVDPLQSLMLDQALNLKNDYAIDAVGFISSQISSREREEVIKQMAAGQLKFVFVSPERLQNKTFRENLTSSTAVFPITYVVIDEAHCVSEWGHDFRTSYLNLGKAINNFCCYKGVIPTIMALTGTASYAVLMDIQREIGIQDEEAIIYPPSFDREELEFGIVAIPSGQKLDSLIGILRTLPSKFRSTTESFFTPKGSQTASGIIFVPHVNGSFGAKQVSEQIENKLHIPIKFYCGSKPKGWRGTRDFDEEKIQVQLGFKKNDFPIFVATNSFGMGIDKPNIRFTIHYNISQSLEAFYQEVGRAGRDQKKSYCALIFSDDNLDQINQALDPSVIINDFSQIQQPPFGQGGDISRLFWFHAQSFRGLEKELEDIKGAFKPLYIALGKVPIGQSVDFNIPFLNDEDRSIKEKAIYRLSIIGAVEDYTINFQARQFELLAIRKQPDEYMRQVQNYVARYKTPIEARSVPEKIQEQVDEGTIYKCARFLVTFVYQEIERKRRTAIRTMVQVARQASKQPDPNGFIRQEILAYMKQTPINELLLKMARRINSKEWWEVLVHRDDQGQPLLPGENGARQLLGSCRRTLESYPDHPGLLFISAFTRFFLPEEETDLAIAEINAGLQNLNLPNDQIEKIILELLGELDKWIAEKSFYEPVKISLATTILQNYPTRKIAQKLMDINPVRSIDILLDDKLQKIGIFSKEFLKGINHA